MKSLKLSLLLLAVSIISFQSCKSTKDMANNQLDGKWVLKTINGQDATEAFTNKVPTIEFDLAKTHISGNSGCNNYNGTYTLLKGGFSAPNLASTMMACPGMNEEYTFTKALAANSVLSVKSEDLVFTQDGKEVLVFSRPRALTAEILAGEWELQWMENSTASVAFGEKFPTMTINAAEKCISGFAGCNRYNSTFEIAANVLTVAPIITTRMACENLEGESKFVSLLGGVTNIELENNALIFKKEGKIVLQFAKIVK